MGKIETLNKYIGECFVIMPISNAEGYTDNHFKRVYEYLIKPACEKAGYKALRSDEINTANEITTSIMEHICNAPIVICDVSNCNSNVFYELGIRHTTLLPVILIKDNKTVNPFDINTIRYFDYDVKLDVNDIVKEKNELSDFINSTMAAFNDGVCINSLFHLYKLAKPDVNNIATTTQTYTSFIRKEVEHISSVIDRDSSSSVGFDNSNIGEMIAWLRMLCTNSEDEQLIEYIKVKYKRKYPLGYTFLF